MSTLVKSAVDFKVQCWINFKQNEQGYEYALLNPTVQYKDKKTNEFKESKNWTLGETLAMIQLLQRAVAVAEERIAPIKTTASKSNTPQPIMAIDAQGRVLTDDSDDEMPF